jgi:hypothetical protein
VVTRASSLRIGPYTLPGPPTVLSADSAGAFASAEESGNIGMRVARRFRIYLDYNRGAMILEPAGAIDAPFDETGCGCAFEAEGPGYHRFKITAIIEQGPAAEAGLQPGDVIAAVDARPANEFTLTQLVAWFEQPVARHIEILRGEGRLTVTLVPRVII